MKVAETGSFRLCPRLGPLTGKNELSPGHKQQAQALTGSAPGQLYRVGAVTGLPAPGTGLVLAKYRCTGHLPVQHNPAQGKLGPNRHLPVWPRDPPTLPPPSTPGVQP